MSGRQGPVHVPGVERAIAFIGTPANLTRTATSGPGGKRAEDERNKADTPSGSGATSNITKPAKASSLKMGSWRCQVIAQDGCLTALEALYRTT